MSKRHQSCVWIAAIAAVVMSWPSEGHAQEPSEQKPPASFMHEGGKFLPGAPEQVTPFPDSPELAGRFSEASIIRMAYAMLEQAIIDSGYGVTFEVSDFRTFYRRDFEDVLLLDVLTLDSPVRLEITETEVGGGDGETVGRAFTPKWVSAFTMEDLAKIDEWLAQFEGYTLAQLLDEQDADKAHRDLIAVTSFVVRVTFDSETKEYRAIFKWTPEERGSVALLVEDHVTDAVEQALVAGQQIAPMSVLLERSRHYTRAFTAGSGEGGEQ